MTLPPPVSVIVVSRHRTADLLRCIEGIRQQDHPTLELIVVADPNAAAAVQALGLPIKLVVFDEPNISAARNIGLLQAAGEVVAFIDDDAVAEPTWAGRLAEPFADGQVVQAGGFVIGRNGISYQWRAIEVDSTGRDHAVAAPQGVSLYRGRAERVVKTQGTNCAFRRASLLAIGGFDASYRFYLDETDVNMRLAKHGGLTAIVPEAVVHHGYAASSQRRADRTPLSLGEIGASTAVFLRRHAPEAAERALVALRNEQRRRLLRLMETGAVEPRNVQPLMATLDVGIAEGRERALLSLQPLVTEAAPFLALPGTGPRGGVVLAGWRWQRERLAKTAQQARETGAIVTVLLLTLGLRRHWQRFGADGVWWQTGGLFGASERSEPIFRPWGLQARIAQETARLSSKRPISGLG